MLGCTSVLTNTGSLTARGGIGFHTTLPTLAVSDALSNLGTLPIGGDGDVGLGGLLTVNGAADKPLPSRRRGHRRPAGGQCWAAVATGEAELTRLHAKIGQLVATFGAARGWRGC